MYKTTLMFALFFILPLTGTADNYLDALNKESADLSVDSSTLRNNDKSKAKVTHSEVPAQLDKTKFNSFLWENYYETYLRLNELNFFRKQSVYSNYLKLTQPNINAVENLIQRER